MVEGQPKRPANIEQIVAINQGRLPLTMSELRAEPLSPRETARRLREEPGLRLLDVREAAEFGQAHVPGAVNVLLFSPAFEQRVGWILHPKAPLLLFARREEDVARALHKMAFLGLDARVAGYVEGGMAAWMEEGLPVRVLPQVSVQDLREAHSSGRWRVVDVREREEWTEGHIQGACHMNFKEMGDGAQEFPFQREESLALVCSSGMRSSTGASLLLRRGFERLTNVVGGMSAWRAAGFEVVKGP